MWPQDGDYDVVVEEELGDDGQDSGLTPAEECGAIAVELELESLYGAQTCERLQEPEEGVGDEPPPKAEPPNPPPPPPPPPEPKQADERYPTLEEYMIVPPKAKDYVDQEADQDGVVWKHGHAALSQKAFHKFHKPTKESPAPRMMALPKGCNVEHWANCDDNVEAAIFKRKVEPAIPYLLSTAKRKQLKCAMLRLCKKGGPFSPEKIAAYASTICTVEELQPKSWTKEKWAREHERAMLDTSLRVSPGIAVKDEILEYLGKDKPRFLIADKEPGQVAARFVIKVFDHLWFEWRSGHHIKYRPKREAMSIVAAVLGAPSSGPTVICEGDGSAWDSCCSQEVRDDTENIVLHHILDELLKHALFLEHLGNAHQKINDDMETKVRTACVKDEPGKKYVLQAIRRSGHAGTSGLNGFLNAVLWSYVLTPEIFRFLGTDNIFRLDSRYDRQGGGKIQVYGTNFFEGDDSILRLPRELMAYDKEIRAAWTELGFHMKLNWRIDDMCTFTGYDFRCRDGKLTGAMVPSIRRNVLGCAYTVSAWARDGWKKGWLDRVHWVAADTMLARAVAYEHDCPPLAHAFALAAEWHHARTPYYFVSQELVEHKGCESTFHATLKRVRESALTCSHETVKFWQESAAGLQGDIQQLSALTGVRPLEQHFLDLVA